MENISSYLEKERHGTDTFLDSFCKQANRSLVKYMPPVAHKALPNFQDIADAFSTIYRNKMVASLVAPALAGAGIGVASVGKESISKEEAKILKEKQKKLKEEFKKLPFLERMMKSHQLDSDLRELRTPNQKRIERAIQGASIGAMAGQFLLGRVSENIKKQMDVINQVASERVNMLGGQASVPAAAQLKVFQKAKDMIKKDLDPIVVGGIAKAPAHVYDEIVSNLKREVALDKLRTNAAAYGAIFNRSPAPISPHAQAYKNLFIQDFSRSVEKAHNVNPGALPGILSKLRSEGILTHKDFVKKYHPDINNSIPLEIKSHFNDIVSALGRKDSAKVSLPTAMDHFVHEFRKSNDPAIHDIAEKTIGSKWNFLNFKKKAGAFKELMIDLEDKKAKEHKKTIPVEES